MLAPGDPMSMYHWEADQEGFLVLSGEALLIVEDEERPLRQWDYFHCPPASRTRSSAPARARRAILALGAREHQDGADWGGYPYSDLAMKHDASAEEETTEPKVAYARFSDPRKETAELPGGLAARARLRSWAWSGCGQRPAPSSAGSSSSSSPKTSSSAATACGRTSSTVTGGRARVRSS